MSEILDSLQLIAEAREKTEREKSQIASEIYYPVYRKQRKNLKIITNRLERSRKIIMNIRKKMRSRENRFSFDLKNIPEFQWFSMKEKDWFFEDDLVIGNVRDAVFNMLYRLQMRDDESRKKTYPIHPVFYTGSDRDIAKFARKIFYREYVHYLQRISNNLDSVQHSRRNNASFEKQSQRYKSFDEYFNYINGMKIDDMEMMINQTLVSQLKKYTAKIEQDFEKKNQLRAKMRDAAAEKSNTKSKENAKDVITDED